jgi:uncharacterized cupin superfamily protein
MTLQSHPVALRAADLPARPATAFPDAFAACAVGRERRPLAQAFGLTTLGVMLSRLTPQARAVLRHAHSQQEEFIFVLSGRATLHTDLGRIELGAGMCAGLPAGTAHDLTNETDEDVVYLEVSGVHPADEVSYPDADLQAVLHGGRYCFTRKDGTAY